MTDDPRLHTAFLGDGEHKFLLTYEMIVELEKVTGAGIGVLANRVFNGQFSIKDGTETLRLALIGAGMNPEKAHEHTNTWVAARPIMETYPTVVEVISRVWFGAPKTDAKEDPPVADVRTAPEDYTPGPVEIVNTRTGEVVLTIAPDGVVQ